MSELREGAPEEAGFSAERIQHIRNAAATWVDEGLTPSVVLLAARRGVVVLNEAFGILDFEDPSKPLTSDTIFPVASLSKLVTASIAMSLVEDGLLSLNRPVVEYIPELSGEGVDKVLVFNLFNHTSGYFDDDGVAPFGVLADDSSLPPRDATQHLRLHQYLNAWYPVNLRKRPGEQLIYANINFGLLGEIIRRVSGMALEDIARERIFEPLGMENSSYRLEDKFRGRIVRRGPDASFGEGQELSLNDEAVLDTPHGAGGVLTCSFDLARFAQMFLNGGRVGDVRVLSSPSVAEMTRNQIPGVGCVGFDGRWVSEACWGLGWMVRGDTVWRYSQGILEPRGTFYHNGGGGSGLWVDPVHEIVGVFLSVSMYRDPLTGEEHTEFDRFQNLVTSAIWE